MNTALWIFVLLLAPLSSFAEEDESPAALDPGKSVIQEPGLICQGGIQGALQVVLSYKSGKVWESAPGEKAGFEVKLDALQPLKCKDCLFFVGKRISDNAEVEARTWRDLFGVLHMDYSRIVHPGDGSWKHEILDLKCEKKN